MSDETRQPPYGDERILLLPNKTKAGKLRLERQVFTEKGFTTFWDEGEKDWVAWRGEYTTLETLGFFDSQDQARDFLVKRSAGAVR